MASSDEGIQEQAEAADSVPTITRVEARKLLGGIPERTFASLEADGILVAAVRGSGRKPSEYDPWTIVPAYIGYLRNAAGKSGGDREARARRDRSQADLNELRILQARKELLPRAQVIRDDRAIIAASKAKLTAVPKRMLHAGLITAEQLPAVVALIREVLEEMARWRKLSDLREAAKGEA